METPYLTRSTPEGARDFLVPVRLQPGSWYALPQSPQLFKQLLMVAGMERYYQLARCFRDEDFRADRQPEFTQIDIEMSFVTRDDVIAGRRGPDRARLWAEIAGYQVPRPIPQMTYADAMARYGSDKPDLRFGLRADRPDRATSRSTEFRVFQAPYVGAVVMPGGAAQTRKELDGWQEWAKSRGARGLAYVLIGADGAVTAPARWRRTCPSAERAGLAAAAGASAGDAVFFAAGTASAGPGPARRGPAGDRPPLRPDRRDRPGRSPGWWTRRCSRRTARAAGPRCTTRSPRRCRSGRTSSTAAPGEALADAYDIVCNGNEIGGGSIRIHRADVQQRVFDVLGLSREEAAAKFGFLLDAFKYGPPPHGGIAFGWDRLCMLLAGRDSIRDVIAFPKTASGQRPADRCPDADHRRAAQGGRHRRQARGAAPAETAPASAG